MSNIIYLKSDKHQINIICSDSEKRYVGKLKQELNRLPVYFVMVNQSIVVNIRHIKEFLLNGFTKKLYGCISNKSNA